MCTSDIHCLVVELHSATTGHFQPVEKVVAHLFEVQRTQVVLHRDALGNLCQLGALENVQQLGLADQDNLHQLVPIGGDVGEHAQLFQGTGGAVLGLVHNQRSGARRGGG